MSFAGPFQTVSTPDPSLIPAAAGGDSFAPIITPDGRYVLFSSTAANLTTNANGAPLAQTFPAKLNVFLRDRTYGTTKLISANQATANGGNGDSLPSEISTNGQFIAFENSASDLVANDTNNVADIFLRDAVSNTTTLISASTNGTSANGVSRSAVMTPDGRYVAFVSVASNLIANDTNNIADIFLRDTWSNTTALVSVGATPTIKTFPFTNTCESPEITPDGRYVAFYSTATNLVPGVNHPGEVYVRDTLAGTTICASLGARAYVQTNTPAGVTNVFYDHAISDDGQSVAFQAKGAAGGNVGSIIGLVLRYNVATDTTDLVSTNTFAPIGPEEEVRTLDMTRDGRFIAYLAYVSNPQASGVPLSVGVKMWDAQTGTDILVSVNTNGTPSTNYFCDAPSIDPTGRFVTFISNAPDLVTNAVTAGYHCYMRDLQSNTTTLVDANASGAIGSLLPSAFPRPSADARYVAFDAFDNKLAPDDNNRSQDIFVRDTMLGYVELISSREPTLPSPVTGSGFNGLSPWSVSADGRFVTFSSLAQNLVTNDNNNTHDVFVRDLLTGTTRLVSVSSNGVSANSASSEPSISGDGRYVAFTTYATDMVLATNRWQNVFVADLQTGTVTVASQNAAGTQGNGNSYSPRISSDGKYVMFRSKANNLATNAPTGETLYVRDMQSSNIYALISSSLSDGTMTRDGRYIAYSGIFSGSGGLWLWSSATATRTLLVPSVIAVGIAITEDGNTLAYVTNGVVHVLANGIDTTVGSGNPLGRYAPRIGGGLVVFGNGTDLMTYDLSQHTTSLVTHRFDSAQSAGGVADFPDISADGRYIVYRSTASNLVQNMQCADTNGSPRLFVYNTTTGTNSILSTGAPSTSGGNLRSFAPIFAADGHTVVFSSYASDLVNGDFNQGSDVFEFAFLYANVTASAGGAIISWPATPGQTYHVQYKDNVQDAGWQTLNGNIAITGNSASITDTSSTSDHRIYRVAAF